jgi:2,4-diaminopentanoate dehydrogenase
MATPRLRIIQWATGNIGLRSLRAVIDHPLLELAGLWVSGADKAGQDAGVLAGTAPCGTIATSDTEALIATEADCVLHMAAVTDIDLLCRLLASGKNVVTTRSDFHHPPLINAGVRAQVEAACAAGGTSLYSTGSSPGFATEALPIALLSLSRRLDQFTIDEYADVSSRNSPDMLFNVMGFGQPLSDFDPRRAEHVKAHFSSSLASVAAAAGIVIDRWIGAGEYAAARADIPIAAGVVTAGTVAAQRITVSGMAGERAILRFRANWYVSRDIDADWDLRGSGWRMQVQGDTPLDVSIGFPVAPEDYAAFTPGLTAHRAVNAVQAVCATAPGIRTTADLPQVIAHLGDGI